jgi:hypothetical protein
MNHFHLQGAVLDQEAFPLPQSGLFADLDAGVGSVALSDEFRGLPGATKLSVLADWQRGLEHERRMALAGLFQEVTESLGNATLPQKITHFRKVCARIGIECPSDMAILLQQY